MGKSSGSDRISYFWFNRIGATTVYTAGSLAGFFTSYSVSSEGVWGSLLFLTIGFVAAIPALRSWRTGAYRRGDTGALVVVNYFKTYTYPPDTDVEVKAINSPFIPCYAPAIVLPRGKRRYIAPLQRWTIGNGPPRAVVDAVERLAVKRGEGYAGSSPLSVGE